MCEFSRLRQFHDYASLRYLYAGWKREERILNYSAPGRAAREGKSNPVRSKQLEHGVRPYYSELASVRASARCEIGQQTITMTRTIGGGSRSSKIWWTARERDHSLLRMILAAVLV